jgi:tRNA threonylcarbamoyladenosine biosynthesis protein TsaB
MLSLGVDTSTPAGSVALAEGNRILGEVNLVSGRHHQERLLRSVDFLLDLSGAGMAGVDVLGVGLGPGTFTGLRIGIATVKGLALARGIPAYGLSTLKAMALLHRERRIPVAPMIDAGRKEAYSALYLPQEGGLVTLLDERGGPPEDFLGALPPEAVLFCGDGVRGCRDLIREARGPEDIIIPGPCFLGPVLARWAHGCLQEGTPWLLGTLRPNYIRPPDAEMRPSP